MCSPRNGRARRPASPRPPPAAASRRSAPSRGAGARARRASAARLDLRIERARRRRRSPPSSERPRRPACRAIPRSSVRRNARSRIGEQLVAVSVACGEVAEARILGELRPADRVAEELPELRLRARDDDPAVGGLEVLEGHDRRMRRVRHPRAARSPRSRPRCRRTSARRARSRRARCRSRSRRRPGGRARAPRAARPRTT